MKEGIENKRKERNTLKKDQVNLKKIILLAIRINNLKKSPQALSLAAPSSPPSPANQLTD